MFAGLVDHESSSSSEDEQQPKEEEPEAVPKPVPSKKTKKKNKKDKIKKKTLEEDLLEAAIQENKEKMAQTPKAERITESILSMSEQFFNAEREIKALFANRGLKPGDLGDKEEQRQPGANQYEGMNKKMR
jgi:hypothetical protein